MTKTVQYFTDEYLEQCRAVKPEQIVEFLENFKALHSRDTMGNKAILISLKVPEKLLASFKLRSQLEGVRYQTQIKTLMMDWLRNQGTNESSK